MRPRYATWEEMYLPNKWMPFGIAMAAHFALFVWNPTIMTSASFRLQPQIIQVRYSEKLPAVLEPVKPVPKPVVEKKKAAPKKAKKSGLSLSRKHSPVRARRHVEARAPAPKRPFVSKIEIPKFVPQVSDEPIAASPVPGVAPAASRKMTRSFAPAPKLKGKSRGVRAEDIHFELSDRGSLVAGAAGVGRVVAIPIGEESGETAVLPSAPVLHQAPKGAKAVAGYRFGTGTGTGSGELVGKDKTGHGLGYHGVVRADTYVEGGLSGGGSGKGRGAVAGPAFEIGGPVGDRRIVRRRIPEYPAWAEEKGVSAMVKIYFTVKSDGSIRSNMRILTSSGYSELDSLAREALAQWRFSATSASSSEESAWGVITFRFTLT
jgi:TonB family protein